MIPKERDNEIIALNAKIAQENEQLHEQLQTAKAELTQARAAAEKLANARQPGASRCAGCPLFETDCYRREKNREDGVKCKEEILEWAYLPTSPEVK